MNTNIIRIVLFFCGLFLICGYYYPKTQLVNNNKKMVEFDTVSQLVELGKQLFFSTELSSPKGVSCASCHSPTKGFSDPLNRIVSLGVFGKLGVRNAPSLAYASFSPMFYFDSTENSFVGGYFWDGRAKDLLQQSSMPIFHPEEMNVVSPNSFVKQVLSSKIKEVYVNAFGNRYISDTASAFLNMLNAIVSYEKSTEMNSFTSKFDYFLQGKVNFTNEEKLGLALFENPKKGNCASCHPVTPDKTTGYVLFTDFTYDNLGVPRNRHIKNSGIDSGLAKTTKRTEDIGKFKVPTLRNVAISAPFFHNGVFNSLEQVVQFYNTRNSGIFGEPEVKMNVNNDELGDLKLSDKEVKAIVAFLFTLTDGYQQPTR